MKFTDRFFGFPIKVYNPKEEDDLGLDRGDDGSVDWVAGTVKLPMEDLRNISWYDGYDKSRDPEDVYNKGFDMTVVCSEVHGQFNCVWKREKFEEKLNEFMERMDVPQKIPYTGYQPYNKELEDVNLKEAFIKK